MSDQTNNLPGPVGDSPTIVRYYALRNYLGIDTLDLDRAYLETPRMVEAAGVLAADADRVENDAKHNYEIARAAAAARLRQTPIGGKEPSQARIDSMLPLEEDVQQARIALDDASYEAQVCTVLFRSMETQSRLLTKASDMVISGLISPDAALDARRRDMRQARMASRPQPQEAPIGRPVA